LAPHIAAREDIVTKILVLSEAPELW